MIQLSKINKIGLYFICFVGVLSCGEKTFKNLIIYNYIYY